MASHEFSICALAVSGSLPNISLNTMNSIMLHSYIYVAWRNKVLYQPKATTFLGLRVNRADLNVDHSLELTGQHSGVRSDEC